MGETNFDDVKVSGSLRVGNVDVNAAEFNALDGVTPGAGAAGKAVILDSSGDVTFPRYFKPSNALPAAAGSGQSDATALAAMVNAVTGADSAKGVALPAAADGLDIWIINTVADQTLKVYPVNGGNDQINALSVNDPFVLGPGKAARFHASSATQWHVDDAAGVTASRTELSKLAGAGAIVASGTQQATVADAKVDYTTGDLDTEAEIISALNTSNGKINSILAALEAFGINASS